jgi:hypothetical protein
MKKITLMTAVSLLSFCGFLQPVLQCFMGGLPA